MEEVRDQNDNGKFSIIKRNQVPKWSTVLPCVCKIKRKRHIMTRKVKHWKARLNVDGSRMTKGVHYDKTKPVGRLVMATKTVFETMVKGNQTRTRKEVQGKIFCYQAMFP